MITGASAPLKGDDMKVRITACILDEVRDAISDVLNKVNEDGVLVTEDPSDYVYFKIANALDKKGPCVIDADDRDVKELISRADYNITSVIPENLEYFGNSYPEDRYYWIGRLRAYKALMKQLTQ